MDDRAILMKLKQADEAGYRAMVEVYGGYVWTILTRVVNGQLPPEDMEEIFADVFHGVWRAAARLDATLPLKPYLAKTARNAAISRLRQQRMDFLPLEEDILLLADTHSPDDLAILRDQQAIITEFVEALSEGDRTVFLGYYFWGLSLSAVGERLDIREDAAKMRLYRLRKRLKDCLSERGYRCED